MSTWVERESPLPELQIWGWLALILAAVILDSWEIGAGLLLVFLMHRARPFDPILAFVLVVAGAAFVTNQGGGLTYKLGLLTSAILLMLMCYVLTHGARVFSITRSSLTLPLVAFMVWSLASAARGVLAGHSLRYLGLELIAILGLGAALVVANAFEERRDLRLAMVALIVIGFATAANGFRKSSVGEFHSANTYTVALPGIIALVLVNLALRAPSRVRAMAFTVLSLPLFLHQLVTFGRGLWTGNFAGLAFSFLVFAGWGRGSGTRWRRCGLVLLTVAGLGLLGAAQLAVLLRDRDLLQYAGSRLASSTSTKVSYETRSNLTRLWEYATVIGRIKASPWVGHGLGYTLPVKVPFTHKTIDQWYVHQSYLMIWMKQGLVGLLLFVWTLWSAAAMGAREARRHSEPWVSAWFAAAGAGTVFQAVFAMTNFPFAMVNEVFLLALLWGGSMAMTRRGFLNLRWSPPAVEGTRLAAPGGHG